MRLDNDDFEDYEGGDFDDNQAFDELMLLVPQTNEDDAWDALEKYDFDVDAAAAHLKSLAKPKAPKVVPKAVPKAVPNAAQPALDSSKGKSKLQSLALKKQNGRGDALSRLRKKGEQGDEQGEQPKSALARLMAKKNSPAATEGGRPGTPSSTASSSSTSTPVASASTPHPGSATHKEPESEPEIAQEIPQIPRPTPSSFGSLLGSSVHAIHTSSVSNAVKTIPASSKNFAKPSPDDQVKHAQEKAFSAPKTEASPRPKQDTTKKTREKDLKAIESLSLKPWVSFVVIGHVDAGKSTLTGRLLLDAGAVPKATVDKYQHAAEKAGKGSFALAWVMDATKEERGRGVTVDIAEVPFETESTRFTVLDAPGHKDYVPNMITGVSQADIAVLVVDSATNAFESGFSPDGQTREHAILARSLGIDSMIIAVNKLDTQNWDKDRFEEIQVQITEFLSKVVGFAPSSLVFIPTSGYSGDYVVKNTGNATWYKGPTLIAALESTKGRQGMTDAPFRMICSDISHERFAGSLMVSGRVVSGVVETGDPIVNCSQTGVQGTVEKVAHDYGIAGQTVKLEASILNNDESKCRAGDVISSPEGVVEPVTSFVAKVILFDLNRPVLVGSKLSFYLGVTNQAVKVKKIEASLDKKGNVLKKNPRHLTRGQAAIIQFTLDIPVPLAPYKELSELGRFVLRLDGTTIGGGIIQETS